MSLVNISNQVVTYYHKEGLWNTLKRIPKKLRWTIFRRRDIQYICDLGKLQEKSKLLADTMTVEKTETLKQIPQDVFLVLFGNTHSDIYRQEFQRRFDRGATLWLPRIDGETAGMIWTIAGTSIEPHYFCITDNDVHLFNGFICKKYRGRRLWPILINYVLFELKKQGFVRAYIETNLANTAAIKAIGKTNVKIIATARKYRLFGRNITIWNNMDK